MRFNDVYTSGVRQALGFKNFNLNLILACNIMSRIYFLFDVEAFDD